MKTLGTVQQFVNRSKDTAEHDFYPSPAHIADDLLKREEKFHGVLWEPACGTGVISQRLIHHKYKVLSTDLIYRGYGEGDVDFLRTHKQVGSIITNPPFDLAEQFIMQGLKCVTDRVCLFLRMSFLESKTRKKLFETTPLARVYIYSERVSFKKDKGIKTIPPLFLPGLENAHLSKKDSVDNESGSGMIAYAWYVWEKGWTHEPVLRWI